jgi:RimJ/RimL family protein N-acetyltransferase
MSSPFSIETERLRLRAVARGDLEQLARLQDDPLVARYMGARDREWYEWRIGASLEEWAERGHGFVSIFDSGGERFDFPYVTAMIRPDNADSIAIAERLGCTRAVLTISSASG